MNQDQEFFKKAWRRLTFAAIILQTAFIAVVAVLAIVILTGCAETTAPKALEPCVKKKQFLPSNLNPLFVVETVTCPNPQGLKRDTIMVNTGTNP